jgi:mutator family transposase
MTFEQALQDGELDKARAFLDELADLPDTGGLWLPECYGDLAQWSPPRSGRSSTPRATSRPARVTHVLERLGPVAPKV